MRWSGPSVVAVILAVTIGGGFTAVLVITAMQAGPITEGGAALLNNLGSVLAGALAGWLGGQAVATDRDRDDTDDDA